jgi:UDP-N-acetylglucosamine 2-epimerase (non-hydrolysing)
MRRAELLFAPSEEANRNLAAMNVRGKVVRVEANTVVDSLRMVLDSDDVVSNMPPDPFVLVTCHRLETITRRQRLAAVVEAINQISSSVRVEFVLHRPTRNYLQRFKLTDKLHQNVTCRDMLEYPQFISLLRHARGVASDGGSIQEECGYLRMPCLVLREATERSDGLGATAILWNRNAAAVTEFVSRLRRAGQPASVAPDQLGPSTAIVDALLDYIRLDT